MFPGQVFHGHVDSLAPASGQEFALLPPDNATGNFTKVVQRIPVKIMLDRGSPLAVVLRPGMSVYPTIDTQGRRPAHARAVQPTADASENAGARAMSSHRSHSGPAARPPLAAADRPA